MKSTRVFDGCDIYVQENEIDTSKYTEMLVLIKAKNIMLEPVYHILEFDPDTGWSDAAEKDLIKEERSGTNWFKVCYLGRKHIRLTYETMSVFDGYVLGCGKSHVEG